MNYLWVDKVIYTPDINIEVKQPPLYQFFRMFKAFLLPTIEDVHPIVSIGYRLLRDTFVTNIHWYGKFNKWPLITGQIP